jgi:predicted nucleic acid-binding protein
MRVYLDASPVIYWVEAVPGYIAKVDHRLKQPGTVLVASDLTRMECLVRPLRAGNAALVQDYEDFFATEVAELIAFNTALFRRAAEIRATHNFKTPDALHLAAAVAGACDLFLTNDAALKAFPDITVEVVA